MEMGYEVPTMIPKDDVDASTGGRVLEITDHRIKRGMIVKPDPARPGSWTYKNYAGLVGRVQLVYYLVDTLAWVQWFCPDGTVSPPPMKGLNDMTGNKRTNINVEHLIECEAPEGWELIDPDPEYW